MGVLSAPPAASGAAEARADAGSTSHAGGTGERELVYKSGVNRDLVFKKELGLDLRHCHVLTEGGARREGSVARGLGGTGPARVARTSPLPLRRAGKRFRRRGTWPAWQPDRQQAVRRAGRMTAW